LQTNFLEAYLSLAERVLSQDRFGLGIELLRRAILAEDQSFDAEMQYRERLEQESEFAASSLVALAVRYLGEAAQALPLLVPTWVGKLAKFVATWGSTNDWKELGNATLQYLERLPVTGVTFERIAALVLALFRPMRRGPRDVSERFLRFVVGRVPGPGESTSTATGSLLLHLLAYVYDQRWISAATRKAAKAAYLSLADSRSAAGSAMADFWLSLSAELRIATKTKSADFGMPKGWSKSNVVETYLSHIWRLNIQPTDQRRIAHIIARRWDSLPQAKQYLVYALLRLNDPEAAITRARVLAATPDLKRPDPFGFLAIAYCQKGDARRATGQLQKTLDFWDSKRRGLRPDLAHWMHEEFAKLKKGRQRELHLTCAELAKPGRLRSLGDVLQSSSSGTA
jgi:hypothetical protein